jgi:phosphoglycolate phosphatase
MRFSAVLFDLDGTLLDTLADIAHSANHVLADLGFPTHDIDAYRHFVGEGLVVLFRKALPADVNADEVMPRCAERFREAYGREWNVRTRPYDGIRELLDALTARPIEMAVLSNKPDAFTRKCVQEYLPEYKFRVVLGQRDSVPRKPDPAGAIEIINEMGIPAEQFLYLGDSSIDMQTATAAGMYAVGALWGFRSLQELQQNGAKTVISQPTDLLELFDE